MQKIIDSQLTQFWKSSLRCKYQSRISNLRLWQQQQTPIKFRRMNKHEKIDQVDVAVYKIKGWLILLFSTDEYLRTFCWNWEHFSSISLNLTVISLPFFWASISSSSIAEFFFSKASKELCKRNKCFHQKALHSKADGTMGNQKEKKWEGDGAPPLKNYSKWNKQTTHHIKHS